MISPRVTAIVLAHNESRQIADCLETLRWADELIVIDSGSTDGTVDIARRYAARVEVWAPYPGYARQRNRALDLASHEWILCVDADERYPAALAEEIRTTIARADAADAYNIAMRTHVLGRWMRSDFWWPQYHVKLFRKGAARWEEREVHPPVITTGRVGRLVEPLDHYPHPSARAFFQKMQRYTDWEARERVKRPDGPPTTPQLALSFLKPWYLLWRFMVVHRGWRDGWRGLCLSVAYMPYPLLADIKSWRLVRQYRPETETYSQDYYKLICGFFHEYESGGDALSYSKRRVLEVAPLRAGERLLDVGCGRGEILLSSWKAGADITGLDFSEASFSYSKSLLERAGAGRIHLMRASATALPFPDNRFDGAFFLDVVEHLTPHDVAMALREIHRVLRPGAWLVVHTMPSRGYWEWGYPLEMAWTKWFKREHLAEGFRAFRSLDDPSHVNRHTTWQLKRALRHAGFTGRVWGESPTPYGGKILWKRALSGWFEHLLGLHIFAVVRKEWEADLNASRI